MIIKTSYEDEKLGYRFVHKSSPRALPEKFVLHNHKDMFEIVVFLKGNAVFRAESFFIGFVYYINKAALPSANIESGAYIRDIIAYLNENISARLVLDDIAEHFFINKYHLCRIFRRHTGMSVNRYINYKRLLLARELCAKGMSLTDAAAEAGFGNYSGFYKLYRREFGISPRGDLKA